MKRALATVLAVFLACPACSVRVPVRAGSPLAHAGRVRAQRQVALQAAGRPQPVDAATWQRYLRDLPVGRRVKIETVDGKNFKAIYMGLDGDNITVRPRTRIPEPIRSIPVASLAAVELDQPGNVGRTIAIVAGSVGATILGLFLIAMASMD